MTKFYGSTTSHRDHKDVQPVEAGPLPADEMRRCGFVMSKDGRWAGTVPALEAALKEIKRRECVTGFQRPAAPEPHVDIQVMATQSALADLAEKIYGGGDDAA